jgi:four helix bundle protein
MARKPLLVQEKAHVLLVQVDRAAKGIKGSQYADLRRQLFKSALSVVSNIAEGREKDGDREFLRFLRIACGSAGELESQVKSAGDCCLIPAVVANELNAKASEVAKMLKGLIKKISGDLGVTDENVEREENNDDGFLSTG